MEFDIQEDRIVIKKGSRGSGIAMVIGGAFLALCFWTIDGLSNTHFHSRYDPRFFSLGLIFLGIITFVNAYRQIIIDKDGIRGLSKGDLKWDEIRKVKMEQQRVESWKRSGIFNSALPHWGLSIYFKLDETFIPFDDDRPRMDVVQAINAIAPFEVIIDQVAMAEYREAVDIYEENKKAKAEVPPPEEEKKPVDNSITMPMVVGIVLVVLLIGLMIWRLTQI